MIKYFLLFFIGFAFSILLTPWVRSAARRLGAIDPPNERKVHGSPIPRLGGLAIFIPFHLGLLLSYSFDFFSFPSNFLTRIHFEWLFIASLLAFGVGLMDDIRKIPPSVKFSFQVMAGLIVAVTSYRIESISWPLGTLQLGILSIPITVLWIVGITNAINLLDGLDGLAAGTSLIVCFTMFGVSLHDQNIGIALLSLLLAGSILGYLKYNFHPASIFLGDSGSYFLGFILSILSLSSGLKGTTTFAILIPIMILGLPIMDTFLSMLRRVLKSLHIFTIDSQKNILKFFYVNGKSIVTADRDHIHHRLLKLGLTHRNAVFFLYGVTLLLGVATFSSVYLRDVNQALIVAAIAVLSYIGIKKLGYTEIQLLQNGTFLPFFSSPLVSGKTFKFMIDTASISLAYYTAFLLRFEGSIPPPMKKYYLSTIPLILIVRMVSFYLLGIYEGPWRHIGVADFLKILRASVLGCLATALILWTVPFFGVFSWSILFIDFNFLFILMIGTRGSFRILEHLYLTHENGAKRVLIYGLGRSSMDALQEFIRNPGLHLNPIGFIDDTYRNLKKRINGYPVLGSLDSLESILDKISITEIIIPCSGVSEEKLDRLFRICAAHHISLRRYQTRFEEIFSEQEKTFLEQKKELSRSYEHMLN
ncbi:MAG: glycosyl transferase [Deltaproteobacteria bacterium]|nr:glycosyl transferase [Deltaproteobacteria bacterium]